MTEKTIGYARTANSQRDIGPQIEALKVAGCSEIYSDEATSGNSIHRPGLDQAMAALRSGDTLKVCTLDRLARSRSTLLTITTELMRRGIEFETIENSEEARVYRFQINYGPAVTPDTPLWRRLAYRSGALLVRLSGRGSIPHL